MLQPAGSLLDRVIDELRVVPVTDLSSRTQMGVNLGLAS